MSRYAINEPDFDRYETKPVDAADVPQDGEPWPKDGESWRAPRLCGLCGADIGLHTGTFTVCPGTAYQQFVDATPQPPIDMAEYAAHAIIDALATFQKAVAETDDFDRLMALWKLVRRSEELCADVVNVVAAKVDAIVERRR